MKELLNAASVKEYKYRMRIRPFGIGCQPDGHLRYEDDGSTFGVVVYDHPLDRKDAENFSLAPITEANELNGNIYGVPFGSMVVRFQVVSTDNAVIEVLVNQQHEMTFPYYEFMDEIANATLIGHC